MNTPISRRFALSAALAAPALLSGVKPTFAAPPQVGTQMPGAYRTKLGRFEVTTLLDGQLRREISQNFIPNAALDEIQAALAAELMPPDHYNNHYNFTAINTGDQLILIDVGTGQQFDPSIDQGRANMAAAGIDPAEVDVIIHTHFHIDHVGGLVAEDGSPRYPNARVFFPQPEYQFITDAAAVARMNDFMRNLATFSVRALSAYGDRVEFFNDGHEFAPGLTAMATPGHTPGHMAIHVESAGEELIVIGDSIGLPALFIANPGWFVAFDADGPMAAETRVKLLDRVATDGVRIIGYHFTFPGIGRVGRTADGYRFFPELWQGVL